MRRVLVVSHAAINEPHREPYDRLARDYGWDVHLVAPRSLPIGPRERKPVDAAPPDAAYVLHPLPVPLLRGRLVWFRGLGALVRRLRPGVVFTEYDPGSTPILHAFLAGAPRRTPVVAFSVENIDHRRWQEAAARLRAGQLKGSAVSLAIATLDALGQRATRALACINAEGLEIYSLRRRWRKPLALMPIGTDTARFYPRDAQPTRRELDLEGRFVVGYFGRLLREKGVHLLVEALARLPEHFCLLLDMFTNFAPGSYGDELQRQIDRLGLRPRVRIIDVDHAAVPTYMSCCDAIVLPSLTTARWKEQFGRVLPEAMACGVPVVGSRSGNIPDMLGDAGLLVDEGDPAAIADALRALEADDALRRRLIARGRERVQARFAVDVQVEILDRLLARSLEAA